ncbi:MAG: glycosyltransferase [Myxococcota bacterium]
MVENLDRSRYQLDFLCKGGEEGPLAPQFKAFGSKVFLAPLSPTHIGFINKARKIIKEGEYDIIHNHIETYSWLGVYLARQFNIPVITSFHNTDISPQHRALRLPAIRQLRALYGNVSIKYAVRNSDAVTSISPGVTEFLKNNYGADPDKVILVTYGVKMRPHASEEEKKIFRKELGFGENTKIVLHVGRFLEQKNHFGLVRIAKTVLKKRADTGFVLIGDGPLKSKVERYIKSNDVKKSFRLLKGRDDIPYFMTHSDLFFLPSLFEGLGLVLLEASAAGLPIVATDVEAIRFAAKNGESGILCPIEREDEFAAAIATLLDDRDYWEEISRKGSEFVAGRFTIEHSVKGLMNLYDSIVKQR